MLDDLRELWRFRELLATMVKRDLRVRYKNSFIGVLWSFINPMMMMLVSWVVFIKFLKIPIPNYTAYFLAAYLPFNFIQVAILDSAQSVLAAQPVVKKVYFPRELLPLSTVLGNFIHFMIGLGVLFIYLLAVYATDRREFPIQATAIYVPLLCAITFIFTLASALIVSALNTFYEDVKYMVTMLLYMLYFICPIMYFAEMVANSDLNKSPVFWYAYNLNPITAMCIAFRKTILAEVPVRASLGQPAYQRMGLHWEYVGGSALISVILLVYGYHLFNQYKWRFMERP